jgi:2-amino-4-hydroxy-6-hydroxymethyldihydropteridine diphosphokinase
MTDEDRSKTIKYLIGLGTNLGNKAKNIGTALLLLEKQGKILKKSHLDHTKAWGIEDQPDFLNMVILLKTLYDPFQLLKIILGIEEKLGRIRGKKWGPRKIDIDILWAKNRVINKNELIIPHPFLHKRDFVLREIIEITPNFIHPIFKKTFKELQEGQ